MNMDIKRVLYAVVVVALLAGNVFFALRSFTAQREAEAMRAIDATHRTNVKMVNFLQMFIAKVLKADGEVDFESRLKLENEVRALKDAEVLAAWQGFVNSQTEADAQKNVKNLMGILAGKINVAR